MLRILVVDDNSDAASLLEELLKNLRHPYEAYFTSDGQQALDFLYRRGIYSKAPRPDLILLDNNMPRLTGLEVLAKLKSDSDLGTIPVIMLSTSNSPSDVRRSYENHVNCYVQKPADLDEAVRLVQAIEAFWMDFAILPQSDPHSAKDALRTTPVALKQSVFSEPVRSQSGPEIAQTAMEAESRTTTIDTGQETPESRLDGSRCETHSNLTEEFAQAVKELLTLHNQQFSAIIERDPDCNRFDLLIHMANEKKQQAKYAYIRHVEWHGCSNLLDESNKT